VLRSPINPDDLITVQIVKKNVRHSAVGGDKVPPDRMHCNNGRPMELIEKLITEAESCDMCGTMFDKD
jgi:hypothetical protein